MTNKRLGIEVTMSRKISFRRIISLILLAIILFSFLPADSKFNASLVEFVAGSQEDLNLFILSKDIDIDLAERTASLRMLMDVETLMVHNSYPQSFKVRTYTFGIGGEEELQSEMNHTIRRKNRTKVRFTLDLGYVEGDQDFYFEVYDSAGRLVNTYRQTIDFSNLQEQVADTSTIADAECDNTSFNTCHLDYIMDKINFLLQPKNTNYSNKIKNPNGTYNVVLSIPRSVKDQVLKGNFNAAALANLNGGGNGNGDNLGNHMATQNLDMKTFDIENVGKITTQDLMVMNGASVEDLVINGDLTIVDGAANGFVLTSDANGNASWKSLAFIANGDNLGNHMATQDLDMKGFSIVNADLLEVESVVINGAVAFRAGAADGYVLTSDANGNGHWRPINTVLNGDDLGNHTAHMDLDMNGHSIVAAQQVNADVLVANVIDVTTVEVGAQIHSPTLHGEIDLNGETTVVGDLIIPEGAQAGYILSSDTNGLASWQAPTAVNGDNLGNHIATTDLNMNSHGLDAVAGINQIMSSVNGTTAIAVDWSNTNIQELMLFGNVSLTFTNAPQNAAELVLILKQDATGGRTLTYPASMKWPDGVAPSLSNGSSAVDIVDCLYHDFNDEYLCNMREKNFQ